MKLLEQEVGSAVGTENPRSWVSVRGAVPAGHHQFKTYLRQWLRNLQPFYYFSVSAGRCMIWVTNLPE